MQRDAQSARDIHDSATVVESLASSSDCQVWLVQTGRGPAVLKSYKRSLLDSERRLQVDLEIELHRRASAASPHVVQFWAARDDATHTHILMDCCGGGDLRGAIGDGAFATERRARDGIARPLLELLAVLARQGIVHRDIKPENVFLASDGGVRLGDFGLAVLQQPDGFQSTCCPDRGGPGGADDGGLSGSGRKGDGSSGADSGGEMVAVSGDGVSGIGGIRMFRDEGDSSGCLFPSCSEGSGREISPRGTQQLQQHAAGTVAYTAPEVLRMALTRQSTPGTVNHKNDVFSLGLVVLECLTRSHPFMATNECCGSALCAALSGDPVPLPPLRSGSSSGSSGSSNCQQCGCGACGVTAPCLDWLRACLDKDPAKRATAEQLLQHEWMSCDLPKGDEGSARACRQRTALPEPAGLDQPWPSAANTQHQQQVWRQASGCGAFMMLGGCSHRNPDGAGRCCSGVDVYELLDQSSSSRQSSSASIDSAVQARPEGSPLRALGPVAAPQQSGSVGGGMGGSLTGRRCGYCSGGLGDGGLPHHSRALRAAAAMGGRGSGGSHCYQAGLGQQSCGSPAGPSPLFQEPPWVKARPQVLPTSPVCWED